MIQTRQQKRAEFALNALKDLKDFCSRGVPEKYAAFIVGMPNMILSNGLGQSLAFLKAKSSREERKFVFGVLKKYLQKEFPAEFGSAADEFSFLEKLNSVSQADYIRMQREVLLMLEWLKRYARAFEGKNDK